MIFEMVSVNRPLDEEISMFNRDEEVIEFVTKVRERGFRLGIIEQVIFTCSPKSRAGCCCLVPN